VAGFGPDVAAFAAATSIGRSREAPTATTMANPSATTIAHAPTFSNRSRSKSRAISRSRTSELRYRPRRRLAPAVRRLERTSARVRIPGLSVGVLPSKAVVNEVGPPLRHLPLSIAQEVSGPPGTLASDAEISGGPIPLHTAIGCGRRCIDSLVTIASA
jgi:hypothetical protein